jgi:hypothetical protein
MQKAFEVALYGISLTHPFCQCCVWFCGCSNGYSMLHGNQTTAIEYLLPIVMCCAYVLLLFLRITLTFYNAAR